VSAEQFFCRTPLPNTYCPVWYAAFMQHHPGNPAQEHFGGLHSGIDILGQEDDEVYSPNDYGSTARVAFIGEYPDKEILIASGDPNNPEAMMLAHVAPIGGIDVNSPCYGPTWVGTLTEKAHVHAALYKGFDLHEVWQFCPEQVRPDVEDPVENDDMKRFLVNPARYAFESAGFLSDDCSWDDDWCWPSVDTADIHYYETDDGIRFWFAAYDLNNSIDDCGIACKPGIYEITLHVDEGETAEDSLCFDRFEDRDGQYPPTQEDFYQFPTLPPYGCNQGNQLFYYLDWDTDDLSGSHTVRIYIRDAANHELQLHTTIFETVMPQITLGFQVHDPDILITWHLPSATAISHLSLHRSFERDSRGPSVNAESISMIDENRAPVEDFRFLDHIPAAWDTLWYTLTGTTSDDEQRVLGRGWVANPGGGGLDLRAWPNPFNPVVQVEFYNPVEGRLDLDVFDVQGRLIRRLVDRELPRGPARVTWDGRLGTGEVAAPGVYFLVARSGQATAVRKTVLVP